MKIRMRSGRPVKSDSQHPARDPFQCQYFFARFHTRLPSPAKAEPAKATSAERTESVDRVKAA